MVTRVQDAGLAGITNRIKGAGTEPLYIAWGTGSGQAAAATTLATEASEARVAGTSSRATTTKTNDTYRVIGTMTVAGAGKTISEVGTFDASSAGNIFVYGDFTGLALGVGEGIQFQIDTVFA